MRAEMMRSGIMGDPEAIGSDDDPDAVGPDDAGQPTPSKRRMGHQHFHEPADSFTPVYAAVQEAGLLFQGHSVMQSGYDSGFIGVQHQARCSSHVERNRLGEIVGGARCDCKPTRRRHGWIAGRGSNAPQRSERRVHLPNIIREPSLSRLEATDRAEARRHLKRMREWPSRPIVKPATSFRAKPEWIEQLLATLDEKQIRRKVAWRLVRLMREGESMTVTEIENAVERVVSRHTEIVLNAIAAAAGIDVVADAEDATAEAAEAA